jgi:hypothetical protein
MRGYQTRITRKKREEKEEEEKLEQVADGKYIQ